MLPPQYGVGDGLIVVRLVVRVPPGVVDDGSSAVNDDFNIVVSNTNDAPTTSGGSASVSEDATHTFTTTASDWGYADVDSGDTMVSIDFTTLPGTGTLMYDSAAVNAGDDIAIANLGGVTYVPVANANGAVTFTFKVFDGDALSANAGTFTLTYSAANDNPSAGATADQTQADINSLAITEVGTISSGTWQGTAIAHAYIGDDAIDGDNIADDAINFSDFINFDLQIRVVFFANAVTF